MHKNTLTHIYTNTHTDMCTEARAHAIMHLFLFVFFLVRLFSFHLKCSLACNSLGNYQIIILFEDRFFIEFRLLILPWHSVHLNGCQYSNATNVSPNLEEKWKFLLTKHCHTDHIDKVSGRHLAYNLSLFHCSFIYVHIIIEICFCCDSSLTRRFVSFRFIGFYVYLQWFYAHLTKK